MHPRIVLSVAFAMASLSGLGKAADDSTHVVSNMAELLDAEKLVKNQAADTAERVTVRIRSGTYLLRDSFRIARSRVSVIAEPGAKFILAKGVNEPVVAIGSQQEVAGEKDVISDIVLTGLEIDGTKDHQRSEYSAARPWIRNNGIDVRAVKNLSIAKVRVNNNRSGGLVISWGCEEVRVSDSSFAKNRFDGVAFYDSTNVEVTRCAMINNQCAGVSLDNEFLNSRFFECLIQGNGDVGVFARSSARVEFKNCVVQNSGNWAFFLAHDNHGRGVVDVIINGGQIIGNRGGVCMASIDEKQSRGTRVTGAAFSGNEGNGRNNIHTSGSAVTAVGIAAGDSVSKVPLLNLATIH